eukprot:4731071-Pyramimonas_sp.AAC.1
MTQCSGDSLEKHLDSWPRPTASPGDSHAAADRASAWHKRGSAQCRRADGDGDGGSDDDDEEEEEEEEEKDEDEDEDDG